MAFAFLADQFKSQKRAHGLLGGNHRGAGQLGLTEDFVQAQLAHQRHEDEQSAEPGAESAWLASKRTHIGNGGGFRTNGGRTFVVASARQAGEAFLMQKDRQRMDADRMALGCELTLNIVDGEILLPQRDGALAVANRRMIRTGARLGKECLAFVGIMAERMAEDAKGTGRIGKTTRDFGGRKLLDEESAERLVLTLASGFGGCEEESGLAIR